VFAFSVVVVNRSNSTGLYSKYRVLEDAVGSSGRVGSPSRGHATHYLYSFRTWYLLLLNVK
jgi:hypothetical protein